MFFLRVRYQNPKAKHKSIITLAITSEHWSLNIDLIYFRNPHHICSCLDVVMALSLRGVHKAPLINHKFQNSESILWMMLVLLYTLYFIIVMVLYWSTAWWSILWMISRGLAVYFLTTCVRMIIIYFIVWKECQSSSRGNDLLFGMASEHMCKTHVLETSALCMISESYHSTVSLVMPFICVFTYTYTYYHIISCTHT